MWAWGPGAEPQALRSPQPRSHREAGHGGWGAARGQAGLVAGSPVGTQFPLRVRGPGLRVSVGPAFQEVGEHLALALDADLAPAQEVVAARPQQPLHLLRHLQGGVVTSGGSRPRLPPRPRWPLPGRTEGEPALEGPTWTRHQGGSLGQSMTGSPAGALGPVTVTSLGRGTGRNQLSGRGEGRAQREPHQAAPSPVASETSVPEGKSTSRDP